MQKSKSKYKNIRAKGSDSKIEVKHYTQLLLRQMSGEIKDIVKQPKFILQEGFKYNGVTVRSIKYTADFQYFDTNRGITIIEELKSSYTAKLADYRIRARLFQYQLKDRSDLLFIETIK
jgi:hypothetical protein